MLYWIEIRLWKYCVKLYMEAEIPRSHEWPIENNWFDFFSYIVKKNTLPSQRKTLRQCLWLGRNVVQAVRVVATLMSLRKNYNVAPMLPRCWIVSSCPNIPWMLYWQRCCNVEISTSNLQPLLSIDLTTSDLRGNVASTSDCGFSSQ